MGCLMLALCRRMILSLFSFQATSYKYSPSHGLPSFSSFCQPINPFTTGNPFLGTKLLGFSIGRGSGALKGSSRTTAMR